MNLRYPINMSIEEIIAQLVIDADLSHYDAHRIEQDLIWCVEEWRSDIENLTEELEQERKDHEAMSDRVDAAVQHLDEDDDDDFITIEILTGVKNEKKNA